MAEVAEIALAITTPFLRCNCRLWSSSRQSLCRWSIGMSSSSGPPLSVCTPMHGTLLHCGPWDCPACCSCSSGRSSSGVPWILRSGPPRVCGHLDHTWWTWEGGEGTTLQKLMDQRCVLEQCSAWMSSSSRSPSSFSPQCIPCSGPWCQLQPQPDIEGSVAAAAHGLDSVVSYPHSSSMDSFVLIVQKLADEGGLGLSPPYPIIQC